MRSLGPRRKAIRHGRSVRMLPVIPYTQRSCFALIKKAEQYVLPEQVYISTLEHALGYVGKPSNLVPLSQGPILSKQ